MNRIILVYGSIAGVIVVAAMVASMTLVADHGMAGLAVGYLSMLIALAMVFVGVKRYRDDQLGGVIRFWHAFAVGLGISLVATLFYALGWEAYLYATDYRFMPDYAASVVAARRASGASAAEIAASTAAMQDLARRYANPAIRLLMTMSEIAPVALVVTLISAAVLRKRDFMPARAG